MLEGAGTPDLALITTCGVVLSTVRWVYSLAVIYGACAVGDAEVNRVLMDKVLPWQATFVTTRELLQCFRC